MDNIMSNPLLRSIGITKDAKVLPTIVTPMKNELTLLKVSIDLDDETNHTTMHSPYGSLNTSPYLHEAPALSPEEFIAYKAPEVLPAYNNLNRKISPIIYGGRLETEYGVVGAGTDGGGGPGGGLGIANVETFPPNGLGGKRRRNPVLDPHNSTTRQPFVQHKQHKQHKQHQVSPHKFLKRKSNALSMVQYPPLKMRRKELPRVCRDTSTSTKSGCCVAIAGQSLSPTTTTTTTTSTATATTQECLSQAAPPESPPNGWTTMHFAAKQGKLEVLEHLIAHGNRSYCSLPETLGGNTPLHIAAQYGHLPICAYLLRLGSQVNATAYDGATPLDRACASDRRKIMKLLKKKGGKAALWENRLQ